jgi:alpha-1,3-glucan synthase
MNILLLLIAKAILAAPWTPENSPWNLNQNRTATDPTYYAVNWPNHTYFPSPANWRMPFYTIMPDRYILL